MIINKLIKGILKDFLKIELTSGERFIADESIKKKYEIAVRRTFVFLILAIFPILFLDTSIIVSVLIPVTMVAGTAWFSISLANMKQKFGDFGLDLTTNLFEAFIVSLGILFELSLFSLSAPFWGEKIATLPNQEIWQGVAFVCGAIVIANIIYKIFIGSIKYDINDAMLTGQNEVAERFYRRSLSLLHSVSSTLREGKSLQVANYYIGVSFFEVFSFIKKINPQNDKMSELIEEANKLIKNPSLQQKKADKISMELIKTFVNLCKNPKGVDSAKSLEAINDELYCLDNNKEDQEMVDTRFAIIFQEIANLLENQGETLFAKNR